MVRVTKKLYGEFKDLEIEVDGWFNDEGKQVYEMVVVVVEKYSATRNIVLVDTFSYGGPLTSIDEVKELLFEGIRKWKNLEISYQKIKNDLEKLLDSLEEI